MPISSLQDVSNNSISCALHALDSYTSWCSDHVINTHDYVNQAKFQGKSHVCFHGMQVNTVLVRDPESTFKIDLRSKAIVLTLALMIENREGGIRVLEDDRIGIPSTLIRDVIDKTLAKYEIKVFDDANPPEQPEATPQTES